MTITIDSAIRSKLLTIIPDANPVVTRTVLADIKQSCYWSADISLARLQAVYNGAAGLVNQEQTELLLNQLEDADIQAWQDQQAALLQAAARAEELAAIASEELEEELEAQLELEQEASIHDADMEEELASEACPGCGAMPGDGYTASCWHSTGCGYLRELEERMADRGQYGRNI